jgi:hypothetical protein
MTEHFRGVHSARKLRAGFKTLADRVSAARLKATLTYAGAAIHDGELTVEVFSS